MMHIVHALGIFLLALVLASCAIESSPPTLYSPSRTSVSSARPASITITHTTSPSEKRIVATEQVKQDNCTGSAPVTNTLGRSHTVLHEVTMEYGAELAAQVGVEIVEIQARIAASYGVAYGEQETIGRSIEVSAREGTRMMHTLEQFELWDHGAVVLTAGAATVSVPYAYCKDFGVELVQSVNQGCAPPPPPATTTCATFSPAEETMRLFALIDAEGQAVENKDSRQLETLFASGATVRDAATQSTGQDAMFYYAQKLKNEVHCQVEHYDYRVLSLTPQEAVVTTGSKGSWGFVTDTPQCAHSYCNPPGADQWRFRRDAQGCWRIVDLTYNISVSTPNH